MKVRAGVKKDLAQITNLRLEFALFEQEYLPGSAIKNNNLLKEETKELLSKNDTKFLVVEEQDKILGYLNFFIYPEFKDKIFIGELYVDSAQRKQGIGQLLIEVLLDWARKNKKKTLRLNISKLNTQALDFFNKNGFKEVSSDYINLEKSI